eukprot:5125961-Pleurochrysis_carterae.AAC.5
MLRGETRPVGKPQQPLTIHKKPGRRRPPPLVEKRRARSARACVSSSKRATRAPPNGGARACRCGKTRENPQRHSLKCFSMELRAGAFQERKDGEAAAVTPLRCTILHLDTPDTPGTPCPSSSVARLLPTPRTHIYRGRVSAAAATATDSQLKS